MSAGYAEIAITSVLNSEMDNEKEQDIQRKVI